MPSTRVTSLVGVLEVQSPAEVIRSPATKLVCLDRRTGLPQLVRLGSQGAIRRHHGLSQKWGGRMDLEGTVTHHGLILAVSKEVAID